MFNSILIFEYDLILGSYLMFLGPNGLFLGSGLGSKMVFGSTHVANQLLFSIVSSILTFDFDLIFGTFFHCLGPLLAVFGVRLGSQNFFGV